MGAETCLQAVSHVPANDNATSTTRVHRTRRSGRSYRALDGHSLNYKGSGVQLPGKPGPAPAEPTITAAPRRRIEGIVNVFRPRTHVQPIGLKTSFVMRIQVQGKWAPSH